MAKNTEHRAVARAMKADRAWDKAHGVKQGSPADKKRDAAVVKGVQKRFHKER